MPSASPLVPRLRLRSGLRLLDRGDGLELASAGEATVVRGLSAADRRTLRQLAAMGAPAADVPLRLRELLEEAGLVEDPDAVARQLAGLGLPRAERARLQPDLVAAALSEHTPDGGAGVLRARQASVVEVRGLGRVGGLLVNLLRDSGLTSVRGVDEGLVTAEDVAPGGHPASAVDGPRVALVGRKDPRQGREPHLVVLVEEGPSRRLECEDLSRASQPHLVVTARLDECVVGPLVLPGATACRRCLDCTRAERDPEWPAVAASEEHLPRTTPPLVLAVATAALAAAEVLAWVDGRRCLTLNATSSLAVDLRTTRQTWTPHPHCGCRWQPAAEVPHAPVGTAR